ncbi:hypothetical protein GCM10011584_08530 [Nocardioides phosphati]|uniref:DUF4190 domain-containing protein n=1 Tax=Nocardioides phosphati TaxID=1867775 RepID=A0ABQ2N6K5_9ACTN|nr:hypothetical protein [Nocardioides phosphati]GGO86375.1 hypothetical protein GCM10011584_08530 [Nocardioides phosphati]
MTSPLPPMVKSDPDVRRAWWSLAAFIPSFVAASVAGEGLLAALGHSGDETVPPGVALAAGLPAILVFALPALLVGFLGRRAIRGGHPEGRTPVLVAVSLAGVFLALNLVQLIAGLVS